MSKVVWIKSMQARLVFGEHRISVLSATATSVRAQIHLTGKCLSPDAEQLALLHLQVGRSLDADFEGGEWAQGSRAGRSLTVTEARAPYPATLIFDADLS